MEPPQPTYPRLTRKRVRCRSVAFFHPFSDVEKRVYFLFAGEVQAFVSTLRTSVLDDETLRLRRGTPCENRGIKPPLQRNTRSYAACKRRPTHPIVMTRCSVARRPPGLTPRSKEGAREHRRLMQKGLVVDVLDEEIRQAVEFDPEGVLAACPGSSCVATVAALRNLAWRRFSATSRYHHSAPRIT
jgi:hypothetical protein